jgi:uncharacterized protein (DUF1330 family)
MSAYLIALVGVTDDAWIPAYAAEVHDIAARHGGRYLSRSGAVTMLEGELGDVNAIAVIEFPDVAAARAFADDPAYAPHAEARQKGHGQQVLHH